MASGSVPIRLSFDGSKTSQSGFEAVTNVTHDERDNKDWPYLSVAIYGRDGAQLYQSTKYAAWLRLVLSWDEDRLWIASADTGIDVIASTPDGWRRHRWMADAGTKSMIDAESGASLSVVNWEPPPAIRLFGNR